MPSSNPPPVPHRWEPVWQLPARPACRLSSSSLPTGPAPVGAGLATTRASRLPSLFLLAPHRSCTGGSRFGNYPRVPSALSLPPRSPPVPHRWEPVWQLPARPVCRLSSSSLPTGPAPVGAGLATTPRVPSALSLPPRSPPVPHRWEPVWQLPARPVCRLSSSSLPTGPAPVGAGLATTLRVPSALSLPPRSPPVPHRWEPVWQLQVLRRWEPSLATGRAFSISICLLFSLPLATLTGEGAADSAFVTPPIPGES
jgi:hypothetical protein